MFLNPKFTVHHLSVADPGDRIGRAPPPPPFRPFFSSFHSRGRSGRRTVPPLHNVNVAHNNKKCVGVPPPPPQRLFQAWRGIWIPGPPFSQILDPPLLMVLISFCSLFFGFWVFRFVQSTLWCPARHLRTRTMPKALFIRVM